ncbi:hypothetical protein HOLleu_23143 [Holothuria leucospilota]|uniref:Uncharacterized protein n=1 Tax=Holothuria leucospilota TaxID=206669 RepID=A0A9Q1BUQ5_HOLLE|nr:hypothetical protein HOLleu_23143 [Holothuria leucospilota]
MYKIKSPVCLKTPPGTQFLSKFRMPRISSHNVVSALLWFKVIHLIVFRRLSHRRNSQLISGCYRQLLLWFKVIHLIVI